MSGQIEQDGITIRHKHSCGSHFGPEGHGAVDSHCPKDSTIIGGGQIIININFGPSPHADVSSQEAIGKGIAATLLKALNVKPKKGQPR